MVKLSCPCPSPQHANIHIQGRCLAWKVSPVAPTPFGFLLLFLCVCVLYYKFILYITRGAPNKAVKKKFPAALPFYVTDPQGRINYKFKLLTGVNEPQGSTSSFLTCPWCTLLSSPLQSRLVQQSIAHCLGQSTFTFTMLKWLPKLPVTFHNIT